MCDIVLNSILMSGLVCIDRPVGKKMRRTAIGNHPKKSEKTETTSFNIPISYCSMNSMGAIVFSGDDVKMKEKKWLSLASLLLE